MALRYESTLLPGVFLIQPSIFEDDRGHFFRVFCQQELREVISEPFVQINHSYNINKGTFRGLHFQYPPFCESKLVRCVSGKVCDIVVDLRKGSPGFMQHILVELSRENRVMIYIPEGCAHGFITLEHHTELVYHHTNFYNKQADAGISVMDAQLNIQLPIPISNISEKDKNYSPIPKDFKGLEI